MGWLQARVETTLRSRVGARFKRRTSQQEKTAQPHRPGGCGQSNGLMPHKDEVKVAGATAPTAATLATGRRVRIDRRQGGRGGLRRAFSADNEDDIFLVSSEQVLPPVLV